MAIGIRGSNPIWAEFDLAGKIFDDTYYMYVLQNTLPYAPATVYHDPNLNQPWTQPIQFLGNGTLPVDIFFESSVVYRLEFRQNDGISPPSQSDPLIYEVNNYVAGSGGSNPIDSVAFASSNQITNPQFSLINFTSPLSLVSVTDPTPIEICPGWVLELSGTGSVTVEKVALNNSNSNPSNAPYALRLTLTGWNSDGVTLRQRFQQNGMLWANKIVSSSITTRIEGIPQQISARLVDSNNSTLAQVLPLTSVNQDWNEFTGYGQLPANSNPNTPPAAYIDYRLSLPNNADIYLSSIQLVVQDVPVQPKFEQDSIDRQIDHTFHYYKNPIFNKPVPSFLVGWDFPLNPQQFFNNAPQAIGAKRSYYLQDQTILFQTANSGITASNASYGSLGLTASANTQFALIQYLSTEKIYSIGLSNLSVNVVATSNQLLTLTASLWWTNNATLPAIASNLSLVTDLDANGYPGINVAAGWNEIPNVFFQGKISVPNTSNTNYFEYKLNGWQNGVIPTGAKFFAIVIGSSQLTAGNTISLNSVSLTPGDIPTRPAPQTQDEVLRECQFYYQKSFLPGQNAAQGVGINSGESFGFQVTAGSASTNRGPIVRFPVSMRVLPLVTTYSPIAASAQIANITGSASWTNTVVGGLQLNGFYTQGNSNAGSSAADLCGLHWVADARLGVI